MTAAGIYIHGLCYEYDVRMVTMFILTLILATMLSSPDFLSLQASHKQNYISLHQRGEKVFTNFVYEMINSWTPNTVFLSNYDDFGNSA